MTYEKWRPRLANANDERFIPITFIDEQLAAGAMQFWATDDAALVTAIKEWPGGAVTVETVAAAGRKADIIGPLREAAERFGAAAGCNIALTIGRDGWKRALPEYRHYQSILIKDLG